jgi:hypothetical protein
MEAVLLSLINKRPEEISPHIYEDLIAKSGFKHRVEVLN